MYVNQRLIIIQDYQLLVLHRRERLKDACTAYIHIIATGYMTIQESLLPKINSKKKKVCTVYNMKLLLVVC